MNVFVSQISPELGLFIVKCNLNHKHVKYVTQEWAYWYKVHTAWCKHHFHVPENELQILNQII